MSEGTVTRAAGPVAELLFLHAQTSLHPGSGTALGVVDLPIQRERHTQWPVIPGTSLKGILRDTCRRQQGNTEDLLSVFGPETADADKYAGALCVTDARILAFPVRSLRGVFAWVTCKAVLDRLNRDLRLAHHEDIPCSLKLGPEEAACVDGSPLLLDGDKLVLEEFELSRKVKENPAAKWVAANAVSKDDNATAERIQTCLVVLHDDDFTHFVRHATEVVARVGLDYSRKTVREGALFYQEFLPPETLFYSLVFANDSRHQGHKKKAVEIMHYLRSSLSPVLQVGGDETTGKGFCNVRLSTKQGGAQ